MPADHPASQEVHSIDDHPPKFRIAIEAVILKQLYASDALEIHVVR